MLWCSERQQIDSSSEVHMYMYASVKGISSLGVTSEKKVKKSLVL